MTTETVKINTDDGWTLIDVDEDKFITASKSIEVCSSPSQPSDLVVGHFVKTMGRCKHVNVDGENLYVRGDAWVSFTTGVYASIIDLITNTRGYWNLNGTSYGKITVPIPLIDGDVINLSFVHQTGAPSFIPIIDSDDMDNRNWLAVKRSSNTVFWDTPSFSDVKINGTSETSGGFTVIEGESYDVSLTASSGVNNLSVIGTDASEADKSYFTIYNLSVSGSVNISIPMSEPWDINHILRDSNGNNIGVKYNDVEADYTQTLP